MIIIMTISGFVSNYFKDTCIAIQPWTISWLNPWAFFPLLLSSVGIILTLEVGQLSKLNGLILHSAALDVSGDLLDLD